MSYIKRPVKDLNKEEFDEAYFEMCNSFKKFKKAFPSKRTILEMLVATGEITEEKCAELREGDITIIKSIKEIKYV